MTLRRELLDLFVKSAGDYLDSWFESAPIKAAYGFDGIVGNYASPYSAGSAYVLLHHVFGEVNGKKGAWGHAIGGMGAITQAMAKAAAERGVEIRIASTGARSDRRGRPRGRRGHRERRGRSRALRRLERESQAPVRKIDRRFGAGAGLSRAHTPLALRLGNVPNERRAFGAARLHGIAGAHPERAPHLPASSWLRVSPTWIRPILDAKAGGWSKHPIVEMLIPSTLDDSLAPPGQHVASLFCQHVAPVLPNGASWDDHREEVADVMIELVNSHAPNFRGSILGRQIMSPLDLERTFGLIGGDIFHGALSLDQLFSARPMLGHGDYRGPLRGLYMCGSGTHPGGGVTGAPGHNAAREIIADFRRKTLEAGIAPGSPAPTVCRLPRRVQGRPPRSSGRPYQRGPHLRWALPRTTIAAKAPIRRRKARGLCCEPD